MKSIANLSIALIAVGSFLQTSVAFGWGDLGHETVAEIAERNLSPQAKQGIVEILGPEALALAATWPDAVRDDEDFDPFKDYHFAEVPTGKSYEGMEPNEHADKDAMTVITKYPQIIKKTFGNRSRKMIALRYLVHVIGDVHQPLHVGNGVDMGANLCDVKWDKKDEKFKKLHSVWDTALVEQASDRFQESHEPKLKFYGYKQFADDIIKNNPLTAQESKAIAEAPPLQWLKESQALRASDAYPDEKSDKAIDDRERPYCKVTNVEVVTDAKSKKSKTKINVSNGKYDVESVPAISDEFKAKGEKIIQQRILAGGLRLANVLNKIFAGNSGGKTKIEVLKSMELRNSK